MVLFLLGKEHTSPGDAEGDSLEETMSAAAIKTSSMLDVDLGATALVKLLIKSFDSGFNSLILVLQFPGWEVSTVPMCLSVSLNTAVNCARVTDRRLLGLAFCWQTERINFVRKIFNRNIK